MSWLFSRALVGDYLQATLSDGAPFAVLNLKTQPDGFLWHGRTMECCLLSLYGMTFAHLTGQRGEELLTWFQAGFHVRPTAPPPLAEVARSASLSHSVWEADPDESRMADGLAPRVDRYHATGNGQVPIVAIAALWMLTANAEFRRGEAIACNAGLGAMRPGKD